jgi:hypothetical protein
MHPTPQSPDTPAPPPTGLWGWINHRTGIDGVLRTALYEPIPGGARFAYIFGSGLLFIFLSQIITGVFLALYYVPSADHAHTTVAYITKAVTAGSFLRSLHAYGASAMVVVLLMLRKAGAAVPVDEDPIAPKKKVELFYPRQVLMDLSLTGLLIGWGSGGHTTEIATPVILVSV